MLSSERHTEREYPRDCASDVKAQSLLSSLFHVPIPSERIGWCRSGISVSLICIIRNPVVDCQQATGNGNTWELISIACIQYQLSGLPARMSVKRQIGRCEMLLPWD